VAKVLVIGASRGIGLETVWAALRSGHSVRALARSATSIPIQDADLDKVSGNALDRGTIKSGLSEVEVVIQTPGDLSHKDVQEWIVKSSGLDWTFVRPGLLANSPATGRYRVHARGPDETYPFGL